MKNKHLIGPIFFMVAFMLMIFTICMSSILLAGAFLEVSTDEKLSFYQEQLDRKDRL